VERQNYAKARACFRQVLTEAPNDYVALYESGIVAEHLACCRKLASTWRPRAGFLPRRNSAAVNWTSSSEK